MATAAVASTPNVLSSSMISGARSGFRTFKKTKLSTSELCTSEPQAQKTAVPMDRCGDVPCGDGECDGGTCPLSHQFSQLQSPARKKRESKDDTRVVAAPEPRAGGGRSQPFAFLSQSSSVPSAPGGSARITLKNGTEFANAKELKKEKKKQRNTQGMYSSEFFFPAEGRAVGANLMDGVRYGRPSLARAPKYVCLGVMGCRSGDCLAALQSSDVHAFRQQTDARRAGPGGKVVPWKQLIGQDLQKLWNRTTETWTPLQVALDEACSVPLCPSAYALLCGVAPTTCSEAIKLIKECEVKGGELVGAFPTPAFSTAASLREQRSLDWCTLRAYVADLLSKHEANPAPGAHQPGAMTHITKSTWHSKWEAVREHFKNAARVPGSQSMLKKVWKLETRLKEKKACSHSKCTTCSTIDTSVDSVRGVNTQRANAIRDFSARAQAEHDKLHLGSRSEMDAAGLHAIVEPRHMWTVLVDAATQRNFMLPKFKFRVPKVLAGRPFWSYKLMASYAYGYGFTPFLVHSSQTMGANLTWTVLWKTLCEMRKSYGFWPRILHVTVDNTTGENKNETLLAMCAWLVASKKVSQVRVLFLMVGHTHVIIDHIFGVVTVGLRRKELVTPEDLAQNINASLAANPQYLAKPIQVLHCLWDWKNWCLKELKPTKIARLFRGNVQDESGAYNGMFDLLFSSSGTGLPLLKYREHPSHPWLPEGSHGCDVITQMPEREPELAKMKSWEEWSKEGSQSVKDTIVVAMEFLRSTKAESFKKKVALNAWQAQFKLIPDTIDLLAPSLKLAFEFFNDVPDDFVFRICGPDIPDGTDKNADKEYEEWKKQHCDVRSHPLAIDPVVSSEQSQSEFERKKRALQVALRAGNVHPTSEQSSPIFLGDFVLCSIRTASEGVDLYQVATMNAIKNPYAEDISFIGIMYEHVPNKDVSGMFGSFRMKLTLKEGKRQQTRTTLHRSQIVVFNAALVKKTKVLSLRTLRALALAAPVGYPFPKRSEIPDTHLSLSDEEYDDDDADQPKARKGKQKKPAKQQPAKGKGKKKPVPVESSSSEQDDEDEEDDEDDDDADDGDDDDDDDDGDDDDDDENDEEDVRDDGAFDSDPAVGAVPAAVPLLQGPTVEPVLDKVFALNMRNDQEFLAFKYPVGIAYVRSIDPFKVSWFVLPETQLAPGVSAREKARRWKTTNKFLTFEKYYTDPNWFKAKKKTPPTEAEILEQWYVSAADRNWILPIDVPQPDDPRKVRMSDKFKISMEFAVSQLIPACEAAHCFHGRLIP